MKKGLGISKVQFLIKKIKINSAVFFSSVFVVIKTLDPYWVFTILSFIRFYLLCYLYDLLIFFVFLTSSFSLNLAVVSKIYRVLTFRYARFLDYTIVQYAMSLLHHRGNNFILF